MTTLATYFAIYGRRETRNFIKSKWAPITEERTRGERVMAHRNKLAVWKWGRELSAEIGAKNWPEVIRLLSDKKPHAVAVPDRVTDMLYDNGFRQCAYTNRWQDASLMVQLNSGDLITREAYTNSGGFRCPHCRGRFTHHQWGIVRVNDTGRLYCCQRHAQADGQFRNDDGEWYSHEGAAPRTYVYRYNQSLVEQVGPNTLYPLGLELEVEFRNRDARLDFAKDVAESFHRSVAHCKHDGSLSEYGVEAITGWGGWEAITPVVRKLLGLASKHGGRSYNRNCGQHMSVGRMGMSVAQQARFVVFFNHPANQRELMAFSRRTSTRYANVLARKGCDEFISRCIDNPGYLSGDKYEAVNCLHETHLEVRTFKGALDVRTVLGRMALVRCVAEYCAIDHLESNDLLFPEFVRWAQVSGPNKIVRYLNSYLRYRDLGHLIEVPQLC